MKKLELRYILNTDVLNKIMSLDRKYNEKSGYDLPEKIRNKSDDLLENLRKATLFYEISLKEVVKMYDLTGKGEMMKYILTSGKGLLKPKEKDQVNCYIKYNCSQFKSNA